MITGTLIQSLAVDSFDLFLCPSSCPMPAHIILILFTHLSSVSCCNLSSVTQVASVVGRAELLSALFFLLCLLLQLQQQSGAGNQVHHLPASRLKAVAAVESCVNNNYIVQKRGSAGTDKLPAGSTSSGRSSICYTTRVTVATILLSVTGFLCKEQSLIVLLVSALHQFLLSYSNLPACKNNKRQESISPSRIKFMQASICSQNLHQQCLPDPSCNNRQTSGSGASSRRRKRSGSSSSATDSSPSDSPVLKCRIWRTSHVPLPETGTGSYTSVRSSGRRSRTHLKSALCLVSAFAVALIFRFLLSGGSLSATFNRFDNPAAVEPPATQFLTYGFLSAFNFGLLLLPAYLSCDWTHSSLPLIDSLLHPANLVTVTFFVAIIAFLLSLIPLLSHKQHADYGRHVSPTV